MSSPEQDALLALQDLDTKIDQHRHRRATLPERAELTALEQRRAATEAARAEAKGSAEEVAARQRRLEADMATAEARIAEITRRLSSGGISAAREVAALNDNVDHLRTRVSDLEDQILAAMDEAAPLDERVTSLGDDLAAMEVARQAATERLAAAEVEIDAALVELEADRAAAGTVLTPSQLADYDRLRPRLGGVAVARLVGSRCDGCHLTLPATEIDRLKHLPPEAIVHCDQCGRFLVRP